MASSPENQVDPLQAVLDEAETLMKGLAPSSTDTNSTSDLVNFSIDDDLEDVDVAQHLARNGESDKEAISDHPLSENFLNLTNEAVEPKMNSSQVSPLASAHLAPQPVVFYNSADVSPSFSVPSASRMLHSSANSAPSAVQQTPTGASLDALRASTSRIASNLASFAQRGISQVTNAASGAVTAANVIPGVLSTYPTNSAGIAAGTAPMTLIDLDSEQKAALVQTHVGDLLPGERVIMFLANLLHVNDSSGFSYNYSSQPNVMWCCAMTYYRLILFGTHPTSPPPCPADWNYLCWPPDQARSLLEIPLASIDRVEKSVYTANTSNGGNPITVMGLSITGKDNDRQLRFTTPSYSDTVRAHEVLQTYAFPGRRNLGYLFAFESKREEVMASIITDESTGKKTVTLEPTSKRFDGLTEFGRQLSRGGSSIQQPWAIWTKVNVSYQTCTSYPCVLVGPVSLDENNPEAQRIIRQCAMFRSENRLPALTWCSGRDGASLWRCSQPKVGLQGNRSSADELFLKHIMESASSATALVKDVVPSALPRSMLTQLVGATDTQNWIPESGCGLKILDLRPRSSAIGNRTGGYGYENTSNYPGTTLQFCNVGNIHAVRDSYQRLCSLCMSQSSSDVQWNALVEDTKWLSQIRLILAAAWEAVFWIHVHRLPVLLHCSHGWDRTSQVAVLAQLLLDPHFRTRAGFATLVEKDFMSFGHPFHLRCAHGEGRGEAGAPSSGGPSSDEGQISPVFIQFLDCVYQIVNQYPECFEFNTKYLLVISEHIYSCRFGNFLCDTERERELVAGLRQRTHSIWDYLESRSDTMNETFSASIQSGVMLMPLPTLLRNVRLWRERHCLYGPKQTVRWHPDGRNKVT